MSNNSHRNNAYWTRSGQSSRLVRHEAPENEASENEDIAGTSSTNLIINFDTTSDEEDEEVLVQDNTNVDERIESQNEAMIGSSTRPLIDLNANFDENGEALEDEEEPLLDPIIVDPMNDEGLTHEQITERLVPRRSCKRKFRSRPEKCLICREEYTNEETLGVLDCGHYFHSGCISQILIVKNACPICKATALAG